MGIVVEWIFDIIVYIFVELLWAGLVLVFQATLGLIGAHPKWALCVGLVGMVGLLAFCGLLG